MTARWNHYHAGGPLFFEEKSLGDRAAEIRLMKPERQWATRINALREVKGKLPPRLVEAGAARSKAYAALSKAGDARSKADAAWLKACAAWLEACAKHGPQIKALYEQECHDVPYNWDTRRLVYIDGDRKGQDMGDAP